MVQRENDMAKFKRGSFVRLRYGGLSMTVSNPDFLPDGERNPQVRCTWYVGDLRLHKAFPPDQLVQC